jgi:hypothetical protein
MGVMTTTTTVSHLGNKDMLYWRLTAPGEPVEDEERPEENLEEDDEDGWFGSIIGDMICVADDLDKDSGDEEDD